MKRLFFLLFVSTAVWAEPTVICSGPAAGGYAAFPDVCRLADGELLCVFYSGYAHVSLPNAEWPKGARIMGIRSSDEGRTWSAPAVLIDTSEDDRDPSIAVVPNGTLSGTLLCNWFTYKPVAEGTTEIHTVIARSIDGGKTWSEPTEIPTGKLPWVACSTPVRALPDGSLILGLYTELKEQDRAFGSTIKSYDGGMTWKDHSLVDADSGIRLDAETDVIPLKDGRLFAALRGDRVNMHFALSEDQGKTWGKVEDIGFRGHCPYLLRHSSGTILLGVRHPGTSVYWSTDETATWKGPLQVDEKHGAYPSLIELKDGQVLIVYYEEGAGSGIRAARLKVTAEGVSPGS